MEILEKGERADPCYGLFREEITEENIQALKEGKRLYMTVVGGEYAIVLKYKKSKKADAQKPPEGHWIDVSMKPEYWNYKCSVCGKGHVIAMTPYCYMCGAKMDDMLFERGGKMVKRVKTP